jgi:hypothetical protein
MSSTIDLHDIVHEQDEEQDDEEEEEEEAVVIEAMHDDLNINDEEQPAN